MNEIILHHYELSPYATIIRHAMGLKGLAWKSVEAPLVSPKPDLTALTGGYERVPVLQMGADIYCDTDCITEALESLQPQPSLYPEPMGRMGKMIALWSSNSWFMPAVGAALGAAPDQLPDVFWEDRATRFGMHKETFLPAVPHMQGQFHASADLVIQALADGRDFVGGDAPGHADFALLVNLRFVQMAGIGLDHFGASIEAWAARIDALGFGDREDWSAEQAIDLARQSQPRGGLNVMADSGFSAGQQVGVKNDAPEPAEVQGTLVGLTAQRISIARTDERAGDVHVHLPRLGQVLRTID